MNNALAAFLKFSDFFIFLFPCMCILQAATKILARQLVRLRQQIANLQGSRAQMRGIATHTQVHSQNFLLSSFVLFSYAINFNWTLFSKHVQRVLSTVYTDCLQALHAQTSVAAGMKGAGKAMASMNKVVTFYL